MVKMTQRSFLSNALGALPSIWASPLLSRAHLLLLSEEVMLSSCCVDLGYGMDGAICPTLLSFCLFHFPYSDPFDLNHNLGAGLSRKSKLLLFVNLVVSLVLLMHVIEFLLFSL